MVTAVRVNTQKRFRTAIRSSRPLVSQGGEYGWTEVGPVYASKLAAEKGRKDLVRTRGRVVAIVEYSNGEVSDIYVRNSHRYFRQG